MTQRIPTDMWKFFAVAGWGLLVSGAAAYALLVHDMVRESELGEVLVLHGIVTEDILYEALGNIDFPYDEAEAVVYRRDVEQRLRVLEVHEASKIEHMPIQEKLETFVTREEFNRVVSQLDRIETLLLSDKKETVSEPD